MNTLHTLRRRFAFSDTGLRLTHTRREALRTTVCRLRGHDWLNVGQVERFCERCWTHDGYPTPEELERARESVAKLIAEYEQR